MDSERWLFKAEELKNTPSRNVITEEQEVTYRQSAANLIVDMGQSLQVNQLCIYTAIVYMHRFYMFHSLEVFPRNQIASCCLFLAAKVEEQPRKLEHILKINHRILNKNNPEKASLDVKSEIYRKKQEELIINENILLQTLGFQITVEHPHTYIVKACQMMKAHKDLAHMSYFLATNSLHLAMICMKYKPTYIACMCIHLACKWSGIEFPRSNEGKDWFYYTDKSVTMSILEEITKDFLEVIDKCPPRLKLKIQARKDQMRKMGLNSGLNTVSRPRGSTSSGHNSNRHHSRPESKPVHSHDKPNTLHSHDKPNPLHSHDKPTPIHSHDKPNPLHSHDKPTPIHSHDKPTPIRSLEKPTPLHSHEKPTPIHSHDKSNPVHSHEKPTPIHSHDKPTPIRSLEKPTPLHSHEKSTPLHSHEKPNPLHSHDKPNPLHSHDKPNPLHSRDKQNPLHPRDKQNQVHSHDKSNPVHSHDKPNPIHSHEKPNPVHSNDKPYNINGSTPTGPQAQDPVRRHRNEPSITPQQYLERRKQQASIRPVEPLPMAPKPRITSRSHKPIPPTNINTQLNPVKTPTPHVHKSHSKVQHNSTKPTLPPHQITDSTHRTPQPSQEVVQPPYLPIPAQSINSHTSISSTLPPSFSTNANVPVEKPDNLQFTSKPIKPPPIPTSQFSTTSSTANNNLPQMESKPSLTSSAMNQPYKPHYHGKSNDAVTSAGNTITHQIEGHTTTKHSDIPSQPITHQVMSHNADGHVTIRHTDTDSMKPTVNELIRSSLSSDTSNNTIRSILTSQSSSKPSSTAINHANSIGEKMDSVDMDLDNDSDISINGGNTPPPLSIKQTTKTNTTIAPIIISTTNGIPNSSETNSTPQIKITLRRPVTTLPIPEEDEEEGELNSPEKSSNHKNAIPLKLILSKDRNSGTYSSDTKKHKKHKHKHHSKKHNKHDDKHSRKRYPSDSINNSDVTEAKIRRSDHIIQE